MANGLDRLVVRLPRSAKRALVIAIDAALCCLAVVLAIYLRIDHLPAPSKTLILAMIFSIASSLPVLWVMGLYRTIMRHVGWSTMTVLVQGMSLSGIVMIGVVTLMGVPGVPRSVGILQPILFLLLAAGSRAAARVMLTGTLPGSAARRQVARVLIYGAGSAGRQLSSGLLADPQSQVVCFVDDDPTLQGRTLNSVPIYAPNKLADFADTGKVTQVLLAIPSATRHRRNEILAGLKGLPVRVQTLPGLSDLARGKVQLSDLRELEIEDLLGREPVAPNAILLAKNIAEKTVLVTGAGGSIGSELCRQILALRPSMLLLVEVSEYALYEIHSELSRRLGDGNAQMLVPLLASVRDKRRMDEIIGTWHPDTVYHAAAYKHVPMVEHNVIEGVRNNVWGTLRTARIARAHKVSDFVLISTDKAVRPTNVMGTSKRLAEMVLQAFAAEGGPTRFSMVRFGNVLGSSGSVVPLFRRQIAAGGPVTITHRDMTRYFMTIPEAAQLVIQAGAMAEGGDVFVLDMGEPVRIADLARNMIELSGYSVRDEFDPDGDIAIEVVGLRPGEKLYEELLIGDNPQLTRHARIMRANEAMMPWARLESELAHLDERLEAGDAASARTLLQELVPEYRPDAAVVDWVEVERRSA